MTVVLFLLGVCYYISYKKGIVPWHRTRFQPGEYRLASIYLIAFVLNAVFSFSVFNLPFSMSALFTLAILNDLWCYIFLHDQMAVNKKNNQ